MGKNKFPSGKVGEILNLLKTDRKTALTELKKYLRIKEFNDTDSALANANNFFLLNRVFISSEIDNICINIFKKMNSLFSKRKLNEIHKIYNNDDAQEITDLDGSISECILKLLSEMRKELEIGNF